MLQNVNSCGEVITTSLKVTMLSDVVNRGDSLEFSTLQGSAQKGHQTFFYTEIVCIRWIPFLGKNGGVRK